MNNRSIQIIREALDRVYCDPHGWQVADINLKDLTVTVTNASTGCMATLGLAEVVGNSVIDTVLPA